MQGRLLRLWLAALVVSISLAAAPVYASSTQTLSFSGGDFNTTIPTLVSVSPAAYPSWTAVVFTAHQFNNDTSLYSVDFL